MKMYFSQIKESVEVEIVDVYDSKSRIVGEIYVPVDRSLLDNISDPLTAFASENGYAVDDLYAAYD